MVTHEPLSIAYYCTGHGLGHATRAIEVCKHLVDRGHSVTIVTGAPARVFFQELPPQRFVLRKAVLDCGSKQLDPFTVDVKGSLEEYYNTCVLQRADLLEAEQQWLRINRIDLVVSDVVPIVCAAAAAVGVPCVCVSNFSWDFIYADYLTTNRRTEFQQLVWQIAQDYSKATLLLRLPGYVPMPAFSAIEDVPLVVRHARKFPGAVRGDLNIPPGARVVVLMHGGHKADMTVREDFLPPGWVGVICNGGRPLSAAPLPENFRLAPADAFTPDLVAACDCVLGKIGYGTLSECLAHGRPLVFVRRDFFNEEPFLRKMLEVYSAGVEMRRRDFMEGHWAPYLERALKLNVSYREPTNGAEVVARRLEQLAAGQGVVQPLAPLSRLRDTIVFGYLMQTPKHGGQVEVPDWYINGRDPARRLGSYSNLAMEAGAAGAELVLEGYWEVLEGNKGVLRQLPDTQAFLAALLALGEPPPPEPEPATATATAAAGGDLELPEMRAARSLFRWDAPLYVTRAPGRLDVMGGIADYSGSLVLQMPIAEACHVALQLHPLEAQPVWKHIEARHQKLGGPRPCLRVVSYHADATNRSPTFDLDLHDLYTPDPVTEQLRPLPYAVAQQQLQQEPATAWGAYVAGCLLVLAHETGVVFDQGISILVVSDVPEGKGVSSSAALEVAVMSALAAAHHIPLEGRALALACQAAENLVVGAPCGVMDQLTAGLGVAGQLLALCCQPAEVQGHVPIPPQLRFWGIDSGIRHSVGGADYGSVRVGTFMGLAICSSIAQDTLTRTSSMNLHGRSGEQGIIHAVAAAAEGAAGGADVAGGQGGHDGVAAAAAGLAGMDLSGMDGDSKGSGVNATPQIKPGFGGCLANVDPSQYAELFEEQLPVCLLGRDFTAKFGAHLDSVTRVDPDTRYAVRVPTAHPIHENFRVNSFRGLLSAAEQIADAATAVVAGQLQLAGGGAGSSLDGTSSTELTAAAPATTATAAAAGTAFSAATAQPVGAAIPTAAAAAVSGAKVAAGPGAGAGGTGSPPRTPRSRLGPGSSSTPANHTANTTSATTPTPTNHNPPFNPTNSSSSSITTSTTTTTTGSSRKFPLPAVAGPLELLGELMFQSHASYSRCGLGSAGTNRLVSLVRQHMAAARAAGKPPALFGAKITGGGCGGTVCVLGVSGVAGQAAIDSVVAAYAAETGHRPKVFGGSSMGSVQFGHLKLRRRRQAKAGQRRQQQEQGA